MNAIGKPNVFGKSPKEALRNNAKDGKARMEGATEYFTPLLDKVY
ncbi:hypothetical protein KUL49_31950 [Alteromonas sp. KUL49]|nr:hypothetical protein KUL49_31950 [Alteromonas sp. KUL49]